VGDAEDMKNEAAGLNEQQVAVDEFATQRDLPDGVRSKLCAAIRQFLGWRWSIGGGRERGLIPHLCRRRRVGKRKLRTAEKVAA
jgi:hypothetical protein